MKSAKLAVLAVLAVALTAGGLPAQDYTDLPDPAATGAPAGGAASTLPPTSPAQEPADDATAATVPATPEAAATEPVQPTAPADAKSEQSGGETDDPKDDEGYEPVVGGGFPVPGPNTPMVTDPDGTVRSAVETDISAVHDHGTSTFSARNGGASTAGAAARSGTIKVTLVFATLTDNRNGVDQNAARGSIAEANKYWRAMSNNRLGMSIVAERSINSSANSGQDYADMMNTIRRDLNWYEDPDEALVVFVPAGDLRSGGYGGILGGGWTSGPTSGSVLMPRPSGFTNNVVTHELGHVLGLLHANSLKCNNGLSDVWLGGNGAWGDGSCTSREYGDTSDLMGYAQYPMPVINSFFWDIGGFGRGDEIRNAGTPASSTSYTLRAWAGSDSNRAVKFKDSSGETYYLELRLPVGYDASTAVGGNRGVKIVKRDLANNWALNSLVVAPNTRDFAGYTNANSTWQAGQTFRTHTGTTVKIDWISADAASVTVTGGSAARAGQDIASVRSAQPWLGNATSEVVGGLRDGGSYQTFQNGVIIWAPGYGAHAVSGAVRSGYVAQNSQDGPLGYPTSGELPGGKGGVYQNFEGGVIYWSAPTGARVSPNGEIRQAFARQGWEHGSLGYPTTEIVAIPGGGTFQNYQGGSIMWRSGIGAYVSKAGPIRDVYAAQGYQTGKLGFPLSDEYASAGGLIQDYEGGRLIWSASHGTRTLSGSIGYSYMASGGPAGKLGFPSENEVVLNNGGASQRFQYGTIYWSPGTGSVHLPDGVISDEYRKQGAQNSKFGYPVSGQSAVAGGLTQEFQGGRLTWSPETKVNSVAGSIGYAYSMAGGPSGVYGFPLGQESALAQGAVQHFKNGVIYWSTATGSAPIRNGALLDVYRKQGSEKGKLGYPTAAEVPLANGVYQSFQGGAIYWSPSAGAHSNIGSVRAVYAANGYEHGFLGMPTSGEVPIKDGGVYQSFQGGAIYWSPATGAHANAGGIRTAYANQGWENGPLGFPVTGEIKIRDGGAYQSFQGGTIYWSAATGPQINAGRIRTAYAEQGWENGRLGYPRSGEYAVPGGTEQLFQGGKITLRSNGSVQITYV
ncbi:MULTISPECIES: hypothetical protein [unclassified Arthrobacter]|uniref:hypothetical protein n=1 Tax=unclassified Arthrobacter TaxID=235627 RepID=UPI001E31AF06|nr:MULTISPECIES: hypothetical protein [unclassified Arthrobacter]MCC9145660.1 hypothetical protein [Arthrobacter sp. zg-Y919]MDK1276889.1 hypothetical protein [Arthrobacter sp. zg.Y919]WIB04179.1 hypothetical protein QNO10_05860 [Arthrobacter sp. zg-Y919]